MSFSREHRPFLNFEKSAGRKFVLFWPGIAAIHIQGREIHWITRFSEQ
jgi:hypothetical protein